jgi:hypothetical protein
MQDGGSFVYWHNPELLVVIPVLGVCQEASMVLC